MNHNVGHERALLSLVSGHGQPWSTPVIADGIRPMLIMTMSTMFFENLPTEHVLSHRRQTEPPWVIASLGHNRHPYPAESQEAMDDELMSDAAALAVAHELPHGPRWENRTPSVANAMNEVAGDGKTKE